MLFLRVIIKSSNFLIRKIEIKNTVRWNHAIVRANFYFVIVSINSIWYPVFS